MALNEDPEPPVSSLDPSTRAEPHRPTLVERVMALLEILICSGYPTQIALGTTFSVLGVGALRANGDLSLTFVVVVELADTVLLLSLIAMFLAVHRERPRELLLGTRPIATEVALGVPLAFAALIIGAATLLTVRAIAPWMQTEPTNPFQGLIQTPRDAMLFVLVAVIAGGVREEIQRAFLMRRFERWLGGSTVGLIVTSIAFGGGHSVQGYDAVIATGVLGAFWAFIYLRRRSVVGPMVSHTGFNLVQLLVLLTTGR